MAAETTTAVPCWSSWKTGTSHSSRSLRSTSKQRGAAMSSRLMPPKLPEMRWMVRTSSSTSFVPTQSGKASTPANSLKRTHFPSITGMPASGPMSPSPSTADPSVTTATRFQRRVSSNDFAGSSRMARQGSATPGVYASERSSLVCTRTREVTSSLPRHSACFSRASCL